MIAGYQEIIFKEWLQRPRLGENRNTHRHDGVGTLMCNPQNLDAKIAALIDDICQPCTTIWHLR